MEAKPLQQYGRPNYPTRREVLAGSVSFVLFNLTGNGPAFAESEAGKAVVAPVFGHGTGRGAIGCMVLMLPAFLSEEESMQILREELARHDIQLKPGAELKGVRVPKRVIKMEWFKKEDGTEDFDISIVEVPGKVKPLKLTGIDPKKGVAVKFISERNYFDLGGPSSSSTVQGYNFKDVAGYVAELAKKNSEERLFLGVFYDPMKDESKEIEEDEESRSIDMLKRRMDSLKDRHEESVKLLRQQAGDFVAWLKEQKVIK